MPASLTIWIVIIAAFAAAAWWFLPRWQANSLRDAIPDAKDRADVEDDFRKTVGQLIGGAAVLLTAGLAYWQTQQTLIETARQAEASRTAAQAQTQQTLHEAQLSREAADRQSERSVAASRALTLSQQISKGFEDLGSGNTMVVLGGIYALEGVMQAPEPQYHRPVLEALTAFVRDRTKGRTPTPNEYTITPEQPTIELATALTVIGRRPDDLAKAADLSGVQLWGMKLKGVRLANVDLTDANFAAADLSYADLSGATLTNAYLVRMRLDHVDLNHADLSEAWLANATVDYVDFSGAKLSYTNLTRSVLRTCKFIDTRFTSTTMTDTKILDSDLSTSHIHQTQLNEACGDETKLPPGLTLRPLQRERKHLRLADKHCLPD